MEKSKEKTELEKAQELVLTDMQDRAEKCGNEVQLVLQKYRCQIGLNEKGELVTNAQI